MVSAPAAASECSHDPHAMTLGSLAKGRDHLRR